MSTSSIVTLVVWQSILAKDNPKEAVLLAGKKIIRTWSPWPNAEQMNSTTLRLVTAIGYLPILLVGFFAVYLFCWKEPGRGEYLLMALPAVYFSLLHMIFVGSIRYRQPPLLFIIVLGAGWIAANFLQKGDSNNSLEKQLD